MHKHVPVVDMDIDKRLHVQKVLKLHDVRHMPVCMNVASKGIGIGKKGLGDYLRVRCMPDARDGLNESLSMLQPMTTSELSLKAYCLSLSDHYWICPVGSNVHWDDVNFFTNGFSPDLGDILFGHVPDDPSTLDLKSPDATCDGWLRKCWTIDGCRRVLLKAGSGTYRQEPYNEVIASEIMTRLGIAHVDYSITYHDNLPCCLCDNFLAIDTELVPAIFILDTLKKSNNDSHYTHLLKCCDALGMSDIVHDIDRMLTLDYIIANQDRHYGNFGFVRNVETLEWIGFAPIYDSGTSLWHDSPKTPSKGDAKPFKARHEEQVRLVRDLSWLDPDALEDVPERIRAILSASPDIDDERASIVAARVQDRAGTVARMADGMGRGGAS
jgi:hypothetical protein